MSEQSVSEVDQRSQAVMRAVDSLIRDDLIQVEQILAAELASDNAYLSDILQHATRFRGKRLRPIVLLLTAQACGGIREDHRTLAAVVEMIHLATLVHDDVLDEADTRRHVATVNARWNNETSVLFGDYLFTHAFHLAASLGTTHACRVIGRATNIVCEGELTQIHERGNLDLGEEQYFRIINGKTAELTALCGLLGGHYAGAAPPVVSALEDYGRKLGLAFQIADDLLDLLGSEKKTGKTLGSDLQKQKLTLPLIHLLAHASPADQIAVRQLLLHPSEETRRALDPYLKRNGSLEFAAHRARQLAHQACESLNCLEESPAKRTLVEMAEFSVRRTF